MPDTTSYASVGDDRTASNPDGLLRRTEPDDGAKTKRWKPI